MALSDFPPIPPGGKPELLPHVQRARLLAIQAQRRLDEAEALVRAARREAAQTRLRYERMRDEYEGQETLDYEEGP